MDNIQFEYLVGVVDDTYINSGISPLNSIILARQKLIEEGLTEHREIQRVLMASLYADVDELNFRGISELF